MNAFFSFFSRSLLVLAITLPIIISYFFNTHLVYFSIYGIYIVSYTIVRLLFAYLNNTSYNLNNFYGSTNIMVVGYRENPHYFKSCLESIKTCSYNLHTVNKVLVIIDGNSEDDIYMIDIFRDLFPTGDYINLYNLDQYESHDILSIYNNNKFICITQPHCGKRTAMYTGFKLSLSDNTEFIFSTDSDTIIDHNAIISMNKYMNANPKTVGIVGNLDIFNKYDSVISFLSNLRYWFAFNVERAYQSFNKYVLCISGPIGFYRSNILKLVIDDWLQQTFLGKPCTYGDDRHLTNKILAYGNVDYLPIAKASTETPSDITRFFKQQTRWHKSANRELIWSFPLIIKHSHFMTIDLVYNTIYPFIVIGYMIYLLWFSNIYHLGIFFILAILLTFIKSIYAFAITKNPEMFFYLLYNIIYISFIFPSKINSIISFADISWGTPSRHGQTRHWFDFDTILLFLWNSSLIAGFIYNIYTTFIPNFHSLLLGIPLSIYFCTFISLFFYIKSK